MAKRKAPVPSPEPIKPTFRVSWIWIAVAVVLLAYIVPLASDTASIHWDAVDVHYSAQRYFADHILSGNLPHWTPYIFSGFPFLADPQTGAWYPGNWLFMLMGAGPKALEAEVAAHALLAAMFVFLLLRRWLSPSAATAGALCYALSGFFAGHSSHIGIFESAALFPGLLLALSTATTGPFWRATFLGTLLGGTLILAGHFQTALYVFTGTACVAAAFVIRNKEAARKTLGFLAIVGAGSLLISAIQTLPGLELVQQSIRSSADYSSSTEGVLDPRALVTLALPNFLGATTGEYQGPGDITQYYLYGGFLLLPLALIGLKNTTVRPFALWLGIPALLYMAGPALGVFRIVSWMPGFRSVRAPIHAWFLVAMALAILAAAGVEWLESRWKWAGMLAIAVLGLDLCINNMWTNPLAYAHQSFASLYGDHMDLTRRIVAPALPPLTRFEAPDQLTALGPMNHPLDLRIETTYGYNPLQLSHYNEFRAAFASNPKLRDSLSVSRSIDTKAGALVEHPTFLPRAYFAHEILTVPNQAEALKALATLDPPRQVILEGPRPSVQPDPTASAVFTADGEQAYQVKYKTATAGLLRLSLPYFPGWQATVDGAACPVLRADHAMTAVVVPTGDKELKLRFHSTNFATGAALTGCGILLLAGLAAAGWRRREQAR